MLVENVKGNPRSLNLIKVKRTTVDLGPIPQRVFWFRLYLFLVEIQ